MCARCGARLDAMPEIDISQLASLDDHGVDVAGRPPPGRSLAQPAPSPQAFAPPQAFAAPQTFASPQARAPSPRAFAPAPDAFTPAPDAFAPPPQPFVPEPDAFAPPPQAFVPEPDAFAPPQARAPSPRAFAPPQARASSPGACVPAPDAFAPAPDAFAPPPDAFGPPPDAFGPGGDDADQPLGVERSTRAIRIENQWELQRVAKQVEAALPPPVPRRPIGGLLIAIALIAAVAIGLVVIAMQPKAPGAAPARPGLAVQPASR